MVERFNRERSAMVLRDDGPYVRYSDYRDLEQRFDLELDAYAKDSDIATLSARVAQLEEALGHDQWWVINRAIDRYNAGEISDLHALGLIATGFMALDKARLSALSEKEARG